MPYNGLSANAKGWLLAKHHFATSSIFYQHVKVLSTNLPLSHNSSFFLSSSFALTGGVWRVKSNHEGKQPNAFRSWMLGWICILRCTQGFLCARKHTDENTQNTHSGALSLLNAPSALFSLRTASRDSLLTSCAACALFQTVHLHVVNKTESHPLLSPHTVTHSLSFSDSVVCTRCRIST